MKRRRTAADLLGDEPAPPKRGRKVEDHRQRLVLEQARLAGIRADKLAGVLIERAAVELHWAGIVTDLRSALLAMPPRVGARLGLSAAIVTAIDAEVRDALETLATAQAVADD
jgi:hypothetical protein